ncbi:MAG: hypothetical protein V3S12_00475, partial [Acidiferrobacterales bacterium]
MRTVALFNVALFAISFSISSSAGGLYKGKISDVHAHVKGGVKLKSIIKIIKKTNVDRILIMRRDTARINVGDNTPLTTDQELIDFRNRYPKKVVLGYGLQTAQWISRDPLIIGEIRKQVTTGNYSLIGEVSLRGGGGTGRKLFVSPSDPLFHKVLKVAAETRLPIMLHHTNIKSDEFEQLKTALRSRPEVTVIWAHWCGLSKPDQVRNLLKEFPRLHCDLAWLRKKKKRFTVALVDSEFNFLPAWK